MLGKFLKGKMACIERRDPIEFTPKYLLVKRKAEKEAEKQLQEEWELEDGGFFMGYCHLFWGKKKKILKEKYGIDWRSPAEMNPFRFYD